MAVKGGEAVIPAAGKTVIPQNIETVQYPNLTYKMNLEDETIRNQTTDLEAIRQACYKILNTERYRYLIYSWGYGVELEDLYGKPLPYVYSELPRRIKEALLYDDRITDVIDFKLSHKKSDVTAVFTVVSTAGTLELSKGVNI
jgi:hypothetical protein